MAAARDPLALMGVEVVPLTPVHVDASVRVLAAARDSLLRIEPVLGEGLPDPSVSREIIAATVDSGPAFLALREGDGVGFLAGTVRSHGGSRLAHTRLHQHAVDASDRRDIVRRLYEAMARRVTAIGCFRHQIDVAVADALAVQTWFELGFAVDQIKGVRACDAVGFTGADVKVRSAGPGDLDKLIALAVDLARFHASPPMLAPVFLDALAISRDMEEALQKEDATILVAVDGDVNLGMMQVHPDGSMPRVATIGMAMVANGQRSRGVGSAILAEVLEWARNLGYQHCAVGWTSANPLSDRFWRSRGFKPVRYSLARQIDERVSWANADLKGEDILRPW